MNRRLAPLAAVALVALAACTDTSTPTSPDLSAKVGANTGGAKRISAMTRNLYVGANVDLVIAALATPDPMDEVYALVQNVVTFQQTDLHARMGAIADEIARTRPQVVGLQEVYRIYVDLTAYGLPLVDADFLQELQAAMTARNLPYVVAGKVKETDASLFGGAVQLVDWDVILVDPTRVTVAPGVIARNFLANLGDVGGVTVLRGYVIVQATVDGLPVTLANTHLESGAHPMLTQLRMYQAAELAQVLGLFPRVVLTGDFNEEAGSPMYQALLNGGLVDTWAGLNPGSPGLSCCSLDDLSNATAVFDQRIDFVFERGLDHPRAGPLGTAALIGATSAERIPNAFGQLIWPSDHAGIVTELLVPPANGLRR